MAVEQGIIELKEIDKEVDLGTIELAQSRPLISPNDQAILSYIHRYIIKQETLETSKLNKALQYLSKGTAVTVGSLAGIPYIEVAKKFAGQYKVIGWLLGYGMFAALAGVTTWALLDISHSFDQKTPEEVKIYNKKSTNIKNILYWILVPSLGFCTGIPMAYIGYKYNSESLFLSLTALISETIVNSCALNRTFSQLGSNILWNRKNLKKQQLRKLRREFAKHIRISTEILINMNFNERNELLRFQKEYLNNDITTNISSELILFYKLLNLPKDIIKVQTEHQAFYNGKLKTGVKISSQIFAITWSIVLFKVTLSGTGNAFIGLLSAIPSLLLESDLARTVYAYFYDKLVDIRFNIRNKTLPEAYWPKTNIILTSFGLLTAFLAFGSRAKVVQDNIPGAIGIVLIVLCVISTITYKSAAILQLVTDAIEYLDKKLGSFEQKELSHDLYFLRKLNNLFENYPLDKFEFFINNLKENDIQRSISNDLPLMKLLDEYFNPKIEDEKSQLENAKSKFGKISELMKNVRDSPVYTRLPSKNNSLTNSEENLDFSKTSKCVIL